MYLFVWYRISLVNSSSSTNGITVMTLRSRGAVWSGSSLFAIPFAAFGQNILRFDLFVWILGSLQQSFLASENLETLRYPSGPRSLCCLVVKLLACWTKGREFDPGLLQFFGWNFKQRSPYDLSCWWDVKPLTLTQQQQFFGPERKVLLPKVVDIMTNSGLAPRLQNFCMVNSAHYEIYFAHKC